MTADQTENPRAIIGGNHPPEPTPYELSKKEINDLFIEAKNYLDGDPVETQAIADDVGKLMTKLRDAVSRADERRRDEVKPFDSGKAEVQARYNPLIEDNKKANRFGVAVLAIDACRRALGPYLDRQEAEKRAVADAARREAEERQRLAQEAFRAAQMTDVAARQRAEELAQAARLAEKAAARAEKDRPSVQGGGRAITTRVRSGPVLVDYRAAARHAFEHWPEELAAWLQGEAERRHTAASKAPPGFEIHEERSVA